MAPFRPSGRSNRSGRITTENDPFEGLPVRQWRQTEGIFGLPPPEAAPQDNNCVYPELPMPKDSNLLSEFTQRILREARKPRFAKRKSEPAEQEKVDDDEEPKERPVQVGWAAKKWSQTPRHAETPDREYLAKRRKGLTSTYVEAPVVVPQVATRTAKVRKLDAAGNATVYEVIVAEGQVVEGEVKDEDVSMVDAPTLAPGTVVEGIGVANAEGQVVANDLLQPTPNKRRKPPPPKRKGGPGRGKKKVMFQPAPANGEAAAPATGAAPPTTANGTDTPASAPTGSEHEGTHAEGDDEDGDDGDEGEDGDDDGEDREDGEVSGDETPVVQGSGQDTPTTVPASQPASTTATESLSAAPVEPPVPKVSTENPTAHPIDASLSAQANTSTQALTEPVDPPLQESVAEAAVVPAPEAVVEAAQDTPAVPEPVPPPAQPLEPILPSDTTMLDAPAPVLAPIEASTAPVLEPPPARTASSSPDLPLAGQPIEQAPLPAAADVQPQPGEEVAPSAETSAPSNDG
ncbi:hypothetical protein BDZ85DRAFT_259911 [Elsinoe ampelina]|uniref:Uncharacterized protein n=1 Tax=Elsinoe ampelina TaxID=302913 RepID=A0A6A6GHW5_9PEZI|nr:hypothetical protein BDZ85DRAFT_259911 [Elsinoe ampelina]